MNRFKKALKKIRISLFKGAFVHNPILTQATGIFSIVAAATSLRDSIALTFTAGITLLVCECATALLLKRLPRYMRIAAYALISAVVIFIAEPVTILLSNDARRVLPVYFYLLGVNALTVVRCERFALRAKLRYCIVDAFSATVGFGTVAIIIGLFRELITYGTVFHYSNSAPLIFSSSLPFIAFALLGLFAALHRSIVIKFYPDEKTDTLSFKNAEDKIELKDPGLFRRRAKAKKEASSENFDIISLRTSRKEDD